MSKQQQQPPTLDARISAALGNGKMVAADDLQALLRDISTGIANAERIAKTERDRALDPVVSPHEAEQAQERASIAKLQRARLEAALPRIEQKLAAALAAAYEDRWAADANKVAARVDAAEQQLARYAELADQIVAVLDEGEAANEEVVRINGCAPDGVHRRIAKIDLEKLKNLVLPDGKHPNQNIWPPMQPSVAASYAASMGVPAHPGANWAKAREARAEAVRAEQQRLADYYEQAGRREEERFNPEERERFGRQP